jgi:hypothetical protein
VKVVCGSDPAGEGVAPTGGLAWVPFAASARRELRIGAGVRTVRARLDRDLAVWSTLCGIRWHSRAGTGVALARMTLRRGVSQGCAPPPGASVERASDQGLVLKVSLNSIVDGVGVRVACLKPRGIWRRLDTSSWSKYGDGRFLQVAIGGSWVGWTRQEIAQQSHDSTCSIWRIDLVAGGAPQQFAAAPAGGPGNFCGEQPVIAADGRMAWIALDWPNAVARQPDRVVALTSDGTVVTLDTALGAEQHATLTDLAISADGSTVTWRNRGLERTAVLP